MMGVLFFRFMYFAHIHLSKNKKNVYTPVYFQSTLTVPTEARAVIFTASAFSLGHDAVRINAKKLPEVCDTRGNQNTPEAVLG